MSKLLAFGPSEADDDGLCSIVLLDDGSLLIVVEHDDETTTERRIPTPFVAVELAELVLRTGAAA